jgi:hypothetical protein
MKANVKKILVVGGVVAGAYLVSRYFAKKPAMAGLGENAKVLDKSGNTVEMDAAGNVISITTPGGTSLPIDQASAQSAAATVASNQAREASAQAATNAAIRGAKAVTPSAPLSPWIKYGVPVVVAGAVLWFMLRRRASAQVAAPAAEGDV